MLGVWLKPPTRHQFSSNDARGSCCACSSIPLLLLHALRSYSSQASQAHSTTGHHETPVVINFSQSAKLTVVVIRVLWHFGPSCSRLRSAFFVFESHSFTEDYYILEFYLVRALPVHARVGKTVTCVSLHTTRQRRHLQTSRNAHVN